MADTQTILELAKIEAEVPAPDALLAAAQGVSIVDVIKITEAGSFKRGTIFMKGTDGFVPATAAGINDVNTEAVVLCDDVVIPDGEYIETMAYFHAEFNGAKIILPYETESDNHNELIEAVREGLRKRGLYIRNIY